MGEGHIHDLMGVMAPAKPPRSWAAHCNLFKCFQRSSGRIPPSAVPLVHKKKKNNNPSVERLTFKTAPGLKQTIVADWWEEGDRMISMEKTVAFVDIKGTYALFQLQTSTSLANSDGSIFMTI